MQGSPFLKKRPLCGSSKSVTPVGLGGAWLGRTANGFDDEIAVSTVHFALEQGINLIDTSPLYGESERRLGLALDEWFRRGGRRDDIVLTTKTGTRTHPKDYSAAGTRRSVEESLKLLKTDYFDVVLIHDPDDIEVPLAPGAAFDELLKMKNEKIVRAIGLGVRQHAFHQRCIETGKFQLSLTYRDFNLIDQSAGAGVLEHAAKCGVSVFNAMVVIGGLLGGQDPLKVARKAGDAATKSTSVYTHDPREVERARALWDFCQTHKISLLALNLEFCMREPRITSTLLGVSNSAELEDDLQAIRQPIPETVWQELRERFKL